MERPQGRERGPKPLRVAVEGRREVLDEVHLVDASLRDRLPYGLNRGGVAGVAPGSLPFADAKAADAERCLFGGPDPARSEWKPARLGRIRPRRAPKRPRQPVAEVEVGDDALG